MGVLAKILGSDQVIAKGLELIDDAWESEEEKREGKAKAKIALMNAYAPFKVAQRYLALMFGATFILSFILVLTLTLLGKGDPNEVIEVMDTFQIKWIMGTIVLFYFGGGLAESMKRDAKDT